MTVPAIQTHELTKRYGSTLAVDGLTIRVAPGEIYGFLGLNGAGKSTTIRMLLGLTRPSRGAALLFGDRVSGGGEGPWRRVGYLVDAAHAYPDLTVAENLELARRLHGATDPGAVDRAIELLGLTAYRDRRAGVLSQGNLQRLGLARALLHQPELLVLDEPVNGLDPAGIVEVRELLRHLAHQHGVTVFISSHLLAEVARLATRIAIIDHGRLLAELDADDLERRSHPRLLVDARDRTTARAALQTHGFQVVDDGDRGLALEDPRALEHPEDVASFLVAASAPPTSLHVWQEDLETFFLRLLSEHQHQGAAL
jgi:ABC-2 type transport system ATP-binding protein